MKALFFVVGVLLFAHTISLHAQEQRKKVGVVLSGGGAKGMAHIGALKVIEEAGIPIDYIVGTSMGSIVGGLYSIGYSTDQLDKMVREQDWISLLSDKADHKNLSMIDRESTQKYLLSAPFSLKGKLDSGGGIIRGANLAKLFNELTVGYHDSLDFNKFPIPFACVAYNLVDGTEVDFHSGVLATAMRASMAIPAAFTPVRLNNMVLVDGGVVNNYPVNIARSMGADYIIGVDVRSELKQSDELIKTPDLLGQLIDLMGLELYQKNVDDTHTYIQVNVDGYGAASFTHTAIDSLISRGNLAAKQKIESLFELKELLGLSTDYRPVEREVYSIAAGKKVYVNQISFDGVSAKDKVRLLKRCKINENSELTIGEIEETINILTSFLGYSGVHYKLINNEEGGYDLNYTTERKYQSRINLGVRFDTEETASVEVNATTYFDTRVPTNLTFTGRFGKRYKASLSYSFEPSPLQRFSLSYMFRYDDVDFSQDGEKMQNSVFRHHALGFAYTNTWSRNLRFDLGARFESYDYNKFLYIDEDDKRYDIDNEYFINYYAKLHYSTLDQAYFSNRGISAKLSYDAYTDNLIQYKDKALISTIQASFETVVPVTNRFSILPAVYGRFLFYDGDTPYSKYNTLGGDVTDRFLLDQIPFYGINGCQIMDDFLVVGALKLRQRMGGVHYLHFTTNYALSSERLVDLFAERSIMGFGLGYGMNSMFGPLEATFNYTNRSKKVGFYINLGYKF